jgi:hypothetical protein
LPPAREPTGASFGPLIASLIGGALFKLGDWQRRCRGHKFL